MPGPNPGRAAMIAAWDSDAALDAFCADDPLAERLRPGLAGAAAAAARIRRLARDARPARARAAGGGRSAGSRAHPREAAPAPALPFLARRRAGRIARPPSEPELLGRDRPDPPPPPGLHLLAMAKRRGDARLRLPRGRRTPGGGGNDRASPSITNQPLFASAPTPPAGAGTAATRWQDWPGRPSPNRLRRPRRGARSPPPPLPHPGPV